MALKNTRIFYPGIMVLIVEILLHVLVEAEAIGQEKLPVVLWHQKLALHLDVGCRRSIVIFVCGIAVYGFRGRSVGSLFGHFHDVVE